MSRPEEFYARFGQNSEIVERFNSKKIKIKKIKNMLALVAFLCESNNHLPLFDSPSPQQKTP